MRRLALFGAVLVALAVVALFAGFTRPGASRPAAEAGQAALVTSVTRSCPPAAPGAGAAHISMIALPSQSASSAAPGGTKAGSATPTGSATLSEVPAAPSGESAKSAATAKITPAKPVTVSVPGAVSTVAAPGSGTADGTAVSATGQMAEAFEAEQANSAGIGLVSCSHPSSDVWFVGTGAPEVWLYLMNTGTLAASADVTILTDTGQQDGLANAITVAPNQVVAENVAPFVRGAQALAVHIQTSSGQVAASMWEGEGTGNGAWLPQAAAPATTLVIPGLTVASSSARLFVTVPGSTDARLTVTAYTPSGTFQQFSTTPVDASGGATTPVTLTSLGASAAGLELTSNVPIVASVLVPGSGIGSFTTATAPVTGQGVVAGNPVTTGLTVGLLLTAPSATATANVSLVAADGLVTSPADLRGVTVKAGRTLAVAVPRPAGRQPFAIVLTPKVGSGPLYAARVVTSGTGGLSAPVAFLLPVQSALAEITLPPVDNSYTAVLP